MTTIQIDGLVFRAHSPSCYQLLSVRDDVGDGAEVYVRYDGRRWGIHYYADRVNIFRPFPTRDAAIALIAARVA